MQIILQICMIITIMLFRVILCEGKQIIFCSLLLMLKYSLSIVHVTDGQLKTSLGTKADTTSRDRCFRYGDKLGARNVIEQGTGGWPKDCIAYRSGNGESILLKNHCHLLSSIIVTPNTVISCI